METTFTSDEIYNILEQEIVLLKIEPGEILSENTLCKRFLVSRTPIRSILQRLQQNGFVQIIPHKGTIVTTINLDIAMQWIYQRLAVECMVLRDFIQIYSPADLARLQYMQQYMIDISAGQTEPEFDIKAFLSADLAMHQLWFQVTDKMFLWESLTRPQADYSRFIRLDMVGGRNVPDVLQEHQELIEIIERKDIEAIEPLLKKHLYGGVRRMGEQLFSKEYQRFFKGVSQNN